MALVSSCASLQLDIPPSCLAFYPAHPHFFVVGTYLLHKSDNETQTNDETQKRSGSLELWSLKDEGLKQISSQLTKDYSILDIQWAPLASDREPTLAVATSTGSITFWKLELDGIDERSPVGLTCVAAHQVSDPSLLVLYLQWHPTSPDTIGVTLSDGQVCLYTFPPDDLRRDRSDAGARLHQVGQHSLEAWCLAFSNSDLLSGGDDAVLQRSTLGDEDPATSYPRWTDRRIHQAGVTFILPLDTDLFLTGSYDDHIRLVRAPASGMRKVLAEENLEGGVWRLQILERSLDAVLVLASCMYAGARVVRLDMPAGDDGGEYVFTVVARFEEHESMNYASAVSPLGAGKDEHTILSTSFYDRRMCLWKIPRMTE